MSTLKAGINHVWQNSVKVKVSFIANCKAQQSRARRNRYVNN